MCRFRDLLLSRDKPDGVCYFKEEHQSQALEMWQACETLSA
jgi:hypothetical protein